MDPSKVRKATIICEYFLHLLLLNDFEDVILCDCKHRLVSGHVF